MVTIRKETGVQGATTGYEAELWKMADSLRGSMEFIRSHATGNGNGGLAGDISIFGQESNYTTWRMAKMNLAIRGINGQIEIGDTGQRYFQTNEDIDLNKNISNNLKVLGLLQ